MQSKTIGAIAELKFSTIAIEKGFEVSKPMIDNYSYDLIVKSGGVFNRVQIKSTSSHDKYGGYKVITSRGNSKKQRYSKDCIDLFAIYLKPLNVWYIIPIEQIETITITIYPHKDKRYAMFYEAWELMENGTP